MFTGMRVSSKTQQRLEQRYDFPLPEADSDAPITEVCVDGGRIRLRTPLGEESSWQDYKAISTDAGMVANFQNNSALTQWVNAQPTAEIVTCLGDGHDGVWNICNEIATASRRREILDWYHLMENLHKVGGSLKRLAHAEDLLWVGKVDETIALFENLRGDQARKFCNYLRKHRSRIVNYSYFQAEGICSIGSGAVESAIKQINRRAKLSGAQWEPKNVPQLLAHRTAYLNGFLSL